MSKVYWLIELRPMGGGSLMYYTAPNLWGSNVDLATKFHSQAAANAEASFVRIPDSQHEIVAVDHMWCD